MFRSLEKVYAEKKIGNLRAAVIPYSLSVLYIHTDGTKDGPVLDLTRLWTNEGLEDDLSGYLCELMALMNGLIKKYATSDDASENSKTRELWERIINCDEVKEFMDSSNTSKIIKKHTISREEYKKRVTKNSRTAEVTFKSIQDNVSIHSNGTDFYKKLKERYQKFNHADKEDLDSIILTVLRKQHLSQQQIDAERDLINKIMAKSPDIFDDIPFSNDNFLNDTLDYIVSVYNNSINNQEDVQTAFDKIYQEAKAKDIKDASVWKVVGTSLVKGDAPKITEILYASALFSGAKSVAAKEEIMINQALMIKMVEWDAKKKVLSTGERSYLSEFAYGFKKLSAFHEKNVRQHLQSLTRAGFSVN